MPGPFDRLIDDFESVTGRRLHLDVGEDSGFETVVVTLDGRPNGWFGHAFPTSQEQLLADVADKLQEFLSQDVWGGWPICPSHGTHPLASVVVNGVATWSCPQGQFTAPVGQLRCS